MRRGPVTVFVLFGVVLLVVAFLAFLPVFWPARKR
jgi:hypothetical protein